jgi:hypothetical protein
MHRRASKERDRFQNRDFGNANHGTVAFGVMMKRLDMKHMNVGIERSAAYPDSKGYVSFQKAVSGLHPFFVFGRLQVRTLPDPLT